MITSSNLKHYTKNGGVYLSPRFELIISNLFMKRLSIVLMILAFISCKKDQSESQPTAKAKANPIAAVVENIKKLDDDAISGKTPIKNFVAYAKTEATKTISLSKSTIKSALETAKSYKQCFVVVGVHTVVKIEDLNECKPSGSWGACMPKAKGYIKKGALNYESDYINNIIGRPDNQKRTMYLFN